MNIYTNAQQLIGKTPMLELVNLERRFSLKARLFAKLDLFNLTGSAKDRAALSMILDAEKSGRLKAGSTIIEPTSGNTGIGLAAVGKMRGYHVIIVMPSSMSAERIKMIRAYGAEVILTDGRLGMQGAVEKANELCAGNPGSMIADQFGNKSNAEAHYQSTGPEIFQALDGNVDAFVAGIGTGGTITGVGRYLKEKNPSSLIVGVEPASSPLITEGRAGAHGIQGIGANFIPSVLDMNVVDEVIPVTDESSYEYSRLLCAEEAIMAGISSGAALHAAIELAGKPEMEGKNIVVFIVDGGTRYLSTELF